MVTLPMSGLPDLGIQVRQKKIGVMTCECEQQIRSGQGRFTKIVLLVTAEPDMIEDLRLAIAGAGIKARSKGSAFKIEYLDRKKEGTAPVMTRLISRISNWLEEAQQICDQIPQELRF